MTRFCSALFALLSLTLIGGLVASCGDFSNSHSSLELVNTPVDTNASTLTALTYSQTAELADAGVEVVLLDILEDSRCPRDVYCLWSGRFRAALEIRYGDGKKETIVLGQGPGVSSVFQNDTISIQLIDVNPEAARGTQELMLVDYEIRLAITKIKKTINLHELLDGVRLTTLYDKQFGVIEFEFLNQQAYMILDPNTCRLDDFGKPTGCTKRAVLRRPVALSQSSNFQNKLYLYKLEDSNNFGFVVDFSFETPRFRLVFYDKDGQAVAVRALEAIQKIEAIR